MAWGCFTVIPCPYKKWDENAREHMLFALPFIGLIVGELWYALYFVMQKCLELPGLLTAVILAFFPMLLTGFIHIDGYMDCCDAIGSRRPQEDKLRILKDSHVGAFACIGLVFWALVSTGAMDAALSAQGEAVLSTTVASAGGNASLASEGPARFLMGGTTELLPCLILVPAVSRFMSAISVWSYPPLSSSQYNRARNEGVVATISEDGTVQSEPDGKEVKCNKVGKRRNLAVPLVIVMLALFAIFFAIFDRATFTHVVTHTELVFAVEMVVYFLACLHARKQLGGMSGDISGYSITIAELAAIITIALL